MFGENEVKLSGNLVADAKGGKTKKGVTVSNYRIAVPISMRQRKPGAPNADFFDVSSYGAAATFANEQFKKGMRVQIEGRLVNDIYVTKDGKRVSRNVVIAMKQGIVEKKNATGE